MTQVEALTLLVNAGGLSRRMGRNKALLRVGNDVLIAHVIRRLKHLAPGGVIVVANDPAVIQALPDDVQARVAADRRPDGGALGGLATGLALSKEWMAAVACDMPFADPGLFSYLTGLAGDEWDAIVPEAGGHAQVFHALYHARCLPVMETQLAEGRLAVQAVLDRVRVRWVRGAELDARLTTPDAFLNVNTPEEWAAVQARL